MEQRVYASLCHLEVRRQAQGILDNLLSDALNDYDELFSALTAKRKSVSIPEIPSAKKV